MKLGLYKFIIILTATLMAITANSAEKINEDQKYDIHFLQPSKLGNNSLEKIVKIAAYDNKNSDIKKAIAAANQIQASPDFNSFNNADLAQFYSHLGWIHTEDNNLDEAIKYHTLALKNRSFYDYGSYNFSINQLLLSSVKANKIDDVYNLLAPKHLQYLSIDQMLLVGEFYSESQRFDLAEKVFALANESSKQLGEIERYQYFATHIKHAAIHNRKDVLDKIADEYTGENITIKWSQLIAWKKNNPYQGLPIMKVPPRYPEGALKRGLNGYAIAEYTVDKNGKPKDITIIDAYPKGYFENASIKAAKKFRYNPIIGPDGKSIERHKVRNRFTFYINN